MSAQRYANSFAAMLWGPLMGLEECETRNEVHYAQQSLNALESKGQKGSTCLDNKCENLCFQQIATNVMCHKMYNKQYLSIGIIF